MALMDTPTELNGYPVIRVEQHKNCSTVMVEKPDEIVVATWWPELRTSWSWGHYYGGMGYHNADERRADADKDFNETATRNAKR